MELKFYYCRHCGKIIAIVKDSGTPTVCCNEPMIELRPAMTDGALEKHVPVISKNGNAIFIQVGSEPHPMLPEHYIQWILLQTDKGIHLRSLKPGDKSEISFIIPKDEKLTCAYEYCNLHKLWQVKYID